MPLNIVLLTIDALRADHVSCYGYERETTPFLDRFAENAILYENAYSASSHTREAIPALLTGRHPPDAVAKDFSRGAETIPMHLSDEYVSGAFHSNPYVSRAYGYETGFDQFYDDLRLGQNRLVALIQRALDKLVFNRGNYHARAEVINERSLSWIDSLNDQKPFFLWNHYMDVHGPYNPPDGYGRWSEPTSDSEAQRLYDRLSGDATPTRTEVERAISLYDGEIRYTDEHIGNLIDALEKRDLLANSIVIITSDHGDLFGEYGQYAHPRYVYPELTHVPLIIAAPGRSSGRHDLPASTLDVLPTVLEFVGRPGTRAVGRSLLDPTDITTDRHVMSSATGEGSDNDVRRFAVYGREHGYRLTRSLSGDEITDEVPMQFPSGDEIDPMAAPVETREEIEELRQCLILHSDRHLGNEQQYDDELTEAVSSDIEERLSALGYK